MAAHELGAIASLAKLTALTAYAVAVVLSSVFFDILSDAFDACAIAWPNDATTAGFGLLAVGFAATFISRLPVMLPPVTSSMRMPEYGPLEMKLSATVMFWSGDAVEMVARFRSLAPMLIPAKALFTALP